MKFGKSILAAAAISTALGLPAAFAQQRAPLQDLVDQILNDVVYRTTEAARREVARNTGIDPFVRGWDPARTYRPLRSDASEGTRNELRQLNEEHDRKIAKLEEELRRKLQKAEEEFQRETAKEDKEEKVREKRWKLEEKVNAAYAKFDEKIGEENRRFDEKRAAILDRS